MKRSHKIYNEKAVALFEEADYLQYKMKKFEEAHRMYLKAIAIEPNFTDALNNCAQNLRFNFKDYKGAIEMFSRIIEINPLYELVYFKRGLCKEKLKDFEGQINDYSRHIEINIPDADDFLSKAIRYFYMKKYQNAIDDCKIALALKPEHDFAKKLLNDIALLLDKYNQ